MLKAAGCLVKLFDSGKSVSMRLKNGPIGLASIFSHRIAGHHSRHQSRRQAPTSGQPHSRPRRLVDMMQRFVDPLKAPR